MFDIDKSIKKVLGKTKKSGGFGGFGSFGGSIKRIIGKPKQYGGRRDRDGDGVINKRDCQPFNVMRQDKIKNYKTANQLKERFFYVNSQQTADLAVRLWGWKNLKDFVNTSGYDFSDINNAFFHIEDDKIPSAIKSYTAFQVKKSGKLILSMCGDPSRLSREAFDDYMAMWYRIENGKYYDK